MDKLSVIVPIFNEKKSIPELFDRLVRTCVKFAPFEIIIIDDGSTDGSNESLLEQKKRYPETDIRIIRFRSNFGKSDALDAGFKSARGNIIATIDADLQNPPEEISKLISAIGPHALCAGKRIKREETVSKRFASRVANAIRRKLLRDNALDTACGLKVFRKEALNDLPMFKGMHRFFPALLRLRGLSVIEVDVKDDSRKYGQSKYHTFSRGIPSFFDMLAVYWMRKRKLTYEIESND